MDSQKIVDKMLKMFGDDLVDFEVFPRIFDYQVKLAKFQIWLEETNGSKDKMQPCTDGASGKQ